MIGRILPYALLVSCLGLVAYAQSGSRQRESAAARGGPRQGVPSRSSSAEDIAPIEPLRPVRQEPRRSVARVTQGTNRLPTDQGQVWRDYDISTYVQRVASTQAPEQALVDWILRETGYEVWHGETVCLLNADSKALHVYHTPEVHAQVAEIVDRFVASGAESNVFGLHVVTLGNPNWRTKALPVLKPLSVTTQGLQAWLLAKEDAALMLADWRRRSDFVEHSAPQLLVANGQSAVVAATRPRTYFRDVVLRPDVFPGFDRELAQFEEGFSLEFNPLEGLDGKSVEAVLQCQVDQVERLVGVMLDVPTPLAPRQRTEIQVPQVAHFRVHERFSWPSDRVLLISLGIVAMPQPQNAGGLQIPLISGPDRAELLVLLDARGPVSAAPIVAGPPGAPQPAPVPAVGQRPSRYSNGRY